MRSNQSAVEPTLDSLLEQAGDANPLDSAWAVFLKDKNPAWLKLMACVAKQMPQHIVASSSFGPDTVTFQDALASFHRGENVSLESVAARMRKVGNTYRGQIAHLSLLASDIQELSVDSLSVGSAVNGMTITNTLLANCQKLLSASAVDKVAMLAAGRVPDIFTGQEGAQLHGTLLVDVPFIGLSCGQMRVFCISLQSPLDAIYIPAHRLVIRASALRFSSTDRLTKLFSWILRNLDLYCEFWQQPSASGVRYLVRDKRPYHVLLDELSGLYELQEAGFALPTLFFERASFVEGAHTINFTEPPLNVFPDVLVSNHRRADKDEFSDRYFNYLKQEAQRTYEMVATQEQGTVIWLSISGGEKRRWFEESEALVRFIQWAREHYGTCHFYVDGWTSPLVRTISDNQQIAQHNEIWERVRIAAQVESTQFTSFIGANALRKIWGAGRSKFFISCAGTPSIWPSLIGRVPGVVHNSTSMIKRVQNTYFPDNVVRIPDEQIKDVNEVGDNIRWDKYSYSIGVDSVLRCAQQARYPLADYHIAGQFYTALVAARKNGRARQVETLEVLCKERLGSYRNLQHLLASSAFFGSPEVEVLHEEEGNYRVIDCSVGRTSDVVFVTFGIVSSHIDHTPFAHAFLKESGFKHLHIAQVRKTSYQKLSFEHCAALLQPLVARYPFRFTYGTSLGGYAALYYACAIDANAIASAPRLPLHPENFKFKDELWSVGSHWDEARYEHLPLSEVISVSCPAPFIIYDPSDVIDCNFIQNCIAPYFPSIRYLKVPGSKHGPLAYLLKNGQLKTLIHDHVASIQGH